MIATASGCMGRGSSLRLLLSAEEAAVGGDVVTGVTGGERGERGRCLTASLCRSDLRARVLEGIGDRVVEAQRCPFVGGVVPGIGPTGRAGRFEESRVEPVLDDCIWHAIVQCARGTGEPGRAVGVAACRRD